MSSDYPNNASHTQFRPDSQLSGLTSGPTAEVSRAARRAAPGPAASLPVLPCGLGFARHDDVAVIERRVRLGAVRAQVRAAALLARQGTARDQPRQRVGI